jgi:hypothetical protein
VVERRTYEVKVNLTKEVTEVATIRIEAYDAKQAMGHAEHRLGFARGVTSARAFQAEVVDE